MATGGLDARGVWQYGEDDAASPVSTMLNKLAASVSNALAVLQGKVNGYDAAWIPYTPALTATTTNPGAVVSASGRYKRIGRLVVVQFQLNWTGAGASGTGDYRIGLPVVGIASGPTNGHARGYDQSTGNAHLDLRCSMGSATTLALQYTSSHGGPLGNVGAAAPWVWTTGDILDGYAIYEAA